MASLFTKRSSSSWSQRAGGSFKGVLFGVVLLLLGTVLLFRNEGRAVQRYKALQEGGGAVISVGADPVVPGNEGKLVHVAGRADTRDLLEDPLFAPAPRALKMRRLVSMYQWQEESREETRNKVGGGTETVTTYDYQKVWSPERIDSSRFAFPGGHENPLSFPVASAERTAERVTLGAFVLPPELVRRISGYEPLPVTETTPLPETFGKRMLRQDGGFYLGVAPAPSPALSGDMAVLSPNPAVPRIGDAKISFEVVYPLDVSIIARQTGETFAPYLTRSGGELEMLRTGILDARVMVERAKKENAALTWVLRILGGVLLYLGFRIVLGPLSVLLDVIPALGSLARVGTGLVSLLGALIIWLLVVALAWVWYRPLLGIGLLLLAGALVTGLFKKIPFPGGKG